ncbi:suppressor of tumorigenicity 14 protein isoform X1 [Alligator mississippiensis]|uniref:Suppressor of tumorigenicity 14 protein homolog n=1 Tax=Alligator mississippiensis TaxID=8496 RepID=A0A151NG04_ALLMI|nr:suppressor of tumorigenicity 14 protein isoform X1 [Alligator mississippiensis]KYO35741.1 suppressor of tumorigenicity 14 protein isoform A [Alligator mississippiensis]
MARRPPPPGWSLPDSRASLKYSRAAQEMNGLEEGVEFLPTMNPKTVEKRGPKRWVVVTVVLIAIFLFSLLVGLLVWHFKYRNVPVQKVYNGHLRILNWNFLDAYEDSSSSQFAMLSKKVKSTVEEIYRSNENIGPYHKETEITAFSEGSVIAYYWSEFMVPKHKAEALDRAMANKQSLMQMLTLKSRNPALKVESVVAFPADPSIVQASRNNSCSFSLHAKEGEITSFTTPGFPNSPYPNNARCQWVLRADADSIISLTFKTFDVEPCSEGNDYIKVYNSLSPVEPHALVTLCGSYPPSYNLTFLSSKNVMLVTLVTNAEGRRPGFRAEFFQLPKIKSCGGTLKGTTGTFTTPFYPAHYPPNLDCTWDIEVPSNKNVKVRFNLFYVLEPGVPIATCTKDYVEVSNTKYCGERPRFVVASNTNRITVQFHSDQSYTDTGFSAEFLSYDSSDPCPGRFTCKTGRCIDKALRCDGWMDCSDASDERSCNCTKEQFRCSNGWCKSLMWVCDGVNDCGDNSDEEQCKCPDKNLKCRNGKCIPEDQKCNGKDDCGDGSDENDCVGAAKAVSCSEYTYKCRSNVCVSKKNPECDGTPDCADNSDEENCDCGIRSYSKQSRIVGGLDSEVGEWPWQVSLHVEGQGHICGASLVSNKWLVSAAHCFQDEMRIRYSDSKLWTAFLGLHDQSQRTHENIQKRKIERIITHPNFNDFTYDYDIAVLELQSPVTFSKVVRPICLPDPTHDFPSGKDLWVTGWGATSEGGSGATILQKAEIRIINQTQCNSLLANQMTPRMMCVGILTGGIDACQGDSGGPLASVETSSRMFLAGVVSWGDGCARRNKPGVYTRVTHLRDWIKQHSGV